jgi:acyl carrier protein
MKNIESARLNENQIKLVNKILMTTLSVSEEQLTPDADIEHDLSSDSLDKVNIIMALEEEFGITLIDENSEEVRTVGEIHELVARALQEKASDHA